MQLNAALSYRLQPRSLAPVAARGLTSPWKSYWPRYRRCRESLMSVLPRGAGRLAAAAAAQLGSCGPRLLCAQLQTAAAGTDAGGKEPKAELPKRFYKMAHVAPAEGQARSSMTVAAPGAGTDRAPVSGNDNELMAAGTQGYQVLLDRRVLKTPAGKPLLLPSRLLALAVAAEWEQQVRHPPNPLASAARCIWPV